MDFEVQRPKRDFSEYRHEDIKLSYDFASATYKECENIIKAIVLFGSTARRHPDADKTSDIDIMVLVDDVHIILTQEVMETYRVLLAQIIEKISPRIHVTTVKLSTFWEYMRVGDPIGMNILRDGIPLLDTGFFEPMQRLLQQGRVKPSAESVWAYYSRAPMTLANAQGHIQQACVDLYWAVIDAAHAALMYYNQVPPSPAHVAEMLNEVLVKEQKVLHKKYVKEMEMFYRLFKGLTHRTISTVTGKQYDEYDKKAKDFVHVMEALIDTTAKKNKQPHHKHE